MTKINFNNLSFFIVAFFVVVLLINSCIKDSERSSCTGFVKGEIVKIKRYKYKGYITYNYKVDSINYSGFQRYDGKLNKNADYYKIFCVKYCEDDIENSEIILEMPDVDTTKICPCKSL